MSIVRVHAFSISLDGFGTGEPQTLEEPFGHAGQRLHQWMVTTDSFSRSMGNGPGKRGVENDLVMHSFENAGATILGRNMFGPQRGPWEDEKWKGWWGDNPPYHHPTFVMTHHKRPSLEMEGGTTFHFVDGTPQEVLAMAKEVAGEKDVIIRGGVNVLREFLKAGLIDDAHIAIAPILLGRGERLWDGLENLFDTYKVAEAVSIGDTTHLRIVKRDEAGAPE